MKRRKDGRYVNTVTINGKKRFFYGKTKLEAMEKADRAMFNEIAPQSFAYVADDWSEVHFPTLSCYTVSKYKTPLKRLKEVFGELSINGIMTADVQKFINNFSAKGYARDTVNNTLNVARMIFRHALSKGFISSDPTEFVKLPKGLKKERRELPSDDQAQRILRSSDMYFGIFAFFLLYSGLRRGEALALQWEDIDFEKKIIRVNKVLRFESNSPIIVEQTKTDAGKREVALLDILADKLPHNKKGYVFTKDGKPMSQTTFRKAWAKYCKESGVTVTPHQIRHLYATILYEAGVEEKESQALMGHAKISTTRDIYQHIRLSRMEEARKKLNEFTLFKD